MLHRTVETEVIEQRKSLIVRDSRIKTIVITVEHIISVWFRVPARNLREVVHLLNSGHWLALSLYILRSCGSTCGSGMHKNFIVGRS